MAQLNLFINHEQGNVMLLQQTSLTLRGFQLEKLSVCETELQPLVALALGRIVVFCTSFNVNLDTYNKVSSFSILKQGKLIDSS